MIVALTAHALKADLERCFAAGMDGYIAKPVKPEEMFAEIDRLTSTANATGIPA